MEKVSFKSGSILMDWQWGVLIGFCILLISALIIAKRYGIKNNKHHHRFQQKFTVEQQRVSRTAVIYHLEKDEQQFLIFESEYGVVQLQNTLAVAKSVELDDIKREK